MAGCRERAASRPRIDYGEEVMDVMQVLRETTLFSGMPEAEVKKLASLCQPARSGPGDVICREGEVGKEIYVIVLGSVRAIKASTRGSDETIATLGSRSYFGEMAMVSADDKRSATVQAVEDTHLVRISSDAVKALCAKDASFGSHFFAAVARGLARRLLSIGNDVSDLKAVARGA